MIIAGMEAAPAMTRANGTLRNGAMICVACVMRLELSAPLSSERRLVASCHCLTRHGIRITRRVSCWSRQRQRLSARKSIARSNDLVGPKLPKSPERIRKTQLTMARRFIVIVACRFISETHLHRRTGCPVFYRAMKRHSISTDRMQSTVKWIFETICAE